jgi:hypothetical protein
MIRSKEKRSAIRHRCDGGITLSHIQRQSPRIEARLLNFSANGLSFFSRHPLKPGTTVIVRASGEGYPIISADAGCQLRTVGFVTIKWCLEGSRHGRPIHEMGAAYMMP